MKHTLLPLKLQLFAEGTGSAPQAESPASQQNEESAAPQGRQSKQTGQGMPSSDIVAIVNATMAAVEARQERAGNAAIRSMAEQYGMKADELTAMLEQKRAEKAKQLPQEVQQQIDDYKQQLAAMRTAQAVGKLGAPMNLLDVDAAMKLMDLSGVKQQENGDVTGVQEALDALKQKCPYLFGQEKTGAWAQGRTGGAPGTEETVRDAIRKQLYGK